MKLLTARYIAITGKKEPGDRVISKDGQIHIIRDEEDQILILDDWLKTELFFMYEEYNRQHIYGWVSPAAKWIKEGDKIKSTEVRDFSGCIQVKCQCGLFH